MKATAKKPKSKSKSKSKSKPKGATQAAVALTMEPVEAVEATTSPEAARQDKALPARRRAKEATAPALKAWRCTICAGGFVLIDKPIICPTCYTQGAIRAVEAAPRPEPVVLPDVLDNSAEAVVDRMTAKAAPMTEKPKETYYQQPAPPPGTEEKTSTPAQVSSVDDRAVEIDELIFDERELTMLEAVVEEEFERFPSKIKAFDRATDGGLVVGGVVVLAGEAGSGKTTLSTHIVMEHVLRFEGAKVFLCSGEEPLGRFLPRARRLGYTEKQIKIASKRIGGSRLRNIEAVLDQAAKIEPTLVIVDSMPTIYRSPSKASNKPEIHAPVVIGEICEFASAYGSAIVVIGRLTQDGKVSGGETWLYDLDGCVIRLNRVYKPSGKKSVPPIKTSYVSLRSDKNRFGAEDRIGWMRKGAEGLRSCGRPKFMAPINSRD